MVPAPYVRPLIENGYHRDESIYIKRAIIDKNYWTSVRYWSSLFCKFMGLACGLVHEPTKRTRPMFLHCRPHARSIQYISKHAHQKWTNPNSKQKHAAYRAGKQTVGTHWIFTAWETGRLLWLVSTSYYPSELSVYRISDTGTSCDLKIKMPTLLWNKNSLYWRLTNLLRTWLNSIHVILMICPISLVTCYDVYCQVVKIKKYILEKRQFLGVLTFVSWRSWLSKSVQFN